MIILGLGSNLGDRLDNLRKAYLAIQHLAHVTVKHVSPIYSSDALVPEHAPNSWCKPYLNCAIAIETKLKPQQLLQQVQAIELKLARPSERDKWSPRTIDIDLLTWNDEIIDTENLKVPNEKLLVRPFQAWPLADLNPFWIYPLEDHHQGKAILDIVKPWGSKFKDEAPFRTRQIPHRIDCPILVGIINLTPDSFSDGGTINTCDAFIRRAIELSENGAEILDIGAASMAPNANVITWKEEWQRLSEPLQALAQLNLEIPCKISIDTIHPEIVEKILNLKVDIINDPSGLSNSKMRNLIKESKKKCIFMHHKNLPEKRSQHLPSHLPVINTVITWANNRLNELLEFGIAKEQLIFDPGIGFGKLAHHDLHLINHMEQLQAIQLPILIGHSRKSFLSQLTKVGVEERDLETMLLSLKLAQKKINYLRIHNVSVNARAFKIWNLLKNEKIS